MFPLLLSAVLLFCVLTYLLAWVNVAPAPGRVQLRSDLTGEARAVTFRSSDGTSLTGWLCVPARRPPRGVVILCHGIRASRLAMAENARFLLDAGYAALAFDFRAHGESGGSRITLGWRETEDVLAACSFVRELPELSACKVAVIGDSMGGAAAIMAAARDPLVSAVIAQSPYSRLDRAVRNHFRSAFGPLAWLVAGPVRLWGELLIGQRADRVSPEASIAALGTRPVLLIAGGRDRLCPVEEARRLQAAGGNAELWIVEEAGHVEAVRAEPAEYRRRVLQFLDRHLSGSDFPGGDTPESVKQGAHNP